MLSFTFTSPHKENNYMQLITKCLELNFFQDQHFLQLLITFFPMFPRQFKIFKPFLTFLLQEMPTSLQQNKIIYLLKRHIYVCVSGGNKSCFPQYCPHLLKQKLYGLKILNLNENIGKKWIKTYISSQIIIFLSRFCG